ncbi:hypothetical protein ANCCAN_09560 [Ancylostoma caninum]|uniref:Uncharacterized protein n=1 Tax=Ancylostoma caninum TaxID=29170 RepID=A0A368GJ57_ANCCA|nr:hypothetical protein ANCCAN_09560 [Ancylostoma caninum]
MGSHPSLFSDKHNHFVALLNQFSSHTHHRLHSGLQVYRIEFEHGTTTGKRVIRVDGKVW